MDDIEDEYEKEILDNLQMDHKSEPATESQVASEQYSMKESIQKSIRSSKEIIESSIAKSKSYASSKLSE